MKSSVELRVNRPVSVDSHDSHRSDVCYNRDSHNSPQHVVTNTGSGEPGGGILNERSGRTKFPRTIHENKENWFEVRGRPEFYYVDPSLRCRMMLALHF